MELGNQHAQQELSIHEQRKGVIANRKLLRPTNVIGFVTIDGEAVQVGQAQPERQPQDDHTGEPGASESQVRLNSTPRTNGTRQ